MNADSSPLLDQLQDIHAAANPGWWPPAPGWWVLGLLASLLLAYGVRFLARRLAEQKRRRRLMHALKALNSEFDPRREPHEYLASLNRLFRLVALKAFPGTGCVRLQGEQWVAFIRSLLPEKAETSSLSALANGPYEPCPEFDASALEQHAKTWIRRYG
jgi:hypothetical protein